MLQNSSSATDPSAPADVPLSDIKMNTARQLDDMELESKRQFQEFLQDQHDAKGCHPCTGAWYKAHTSQWVTLFIALGALVIGLWVNYLSGEARKDLDNLEKTQDNLEVQLQQVQDLLASDDVAKLLAAIATSQTTLTQLNASISIANNVTAELGIAVSSGELSTIRADINDAKANASIAATDISNLKQTTTSIASDVTTLRNNATSIKSEVTSLQSETTTLTSDVSELRLNASITTQDVDILKNYTNALSSTSPAVPSQLQGWLKTSYRTSENEPVLLNYVTTRTGSGPVITGTMASIRLTQAKIGNVLLISVGCDTGTTNALSISTQTNSIQVIVHRTGLIGTLPLDSTPDTDGGGLSHNVRYAEGSKSGEQVDIVASSVIACNAPSQADNKDICINLYFASGYLSDKVAVAVSANLVVRVVS